MVKLLEKLGIEQKEAWGVALNIVIILIVFVVLYKLISVLFKRAEKRMHQRFPEANIGLIRFGKYLCIIILAVFCATGISSYFPSMNKFFTSFLAGSGVVALVVSVASQDAIANIVGGLFIIFTRPFKIGDTIRYVDDDITGVVESITLRHTVIVTFEDKRLVIPNSIVNNSAIENMSGSDKKICLLLEVGITYESDAEKAMDIFAEVIKSNPRYIDVRTDEEKAAGAEAAKVRLIRFDDSAVVIRGWVWTDDYYAAIDVKSAMLLVLKKRFEENGIDIAYPHMVVVNEK